MRRGVERVWSARPVPKCFVDRDEEGPTSAWILVIRGEGRLGDAFANRSQRCADQCWSLMPLPDEQCDLFP